MRSKARKACKFLDLETQEEKDDGTIITKFHDYDEEGAISKEDQEFVTDNDESDKYESECSEVHDSEKELDEDDYVLLADNKANEKKRVRIRKTVKSSDSENSESSQKEQEDDDNFIDDSELNQDDLQTLLGMLSPVPEKKSIQKRETQFPSTTQRKLNTIGRLPAVSMNCIGEWVHPENKEYFPQSSSNWNFLNNTSSKKTSTNTTKLPGCILKTSTGDYRVEKNGKRHKLTDGSVCVSNKT
jgi:hypothetical protein